MSNHGQTFLQQLQLQLRHRNTFPTACLAKISSNVLFLCLTMFGLWACDVHEWPEEEQVVETVEPEAPTFTLHLDFSTELPLYQEMEYATRATKLSSYMIRYIVHVFEADEDGNFTRTVFKRIVQTADVSDSLDVDIPIQLDYGSYRFMVWTDYVQSSSAADLFYCADDFADIYLTDNDDHQGCTDARDAFRGTVESEFSESVTEATAEMVRPLAKYYFIANDLQEFFARHAATKTDDDDSRSESVRTVNLDDYTIVFYYPNYMPDTYNMYTDRPGNSATGVYFTGDIVQLSSTEAQLGFDYIIINGTESSVQVALALYSKDTGEQISMTDAITLPLKRSTYTIVRGAFLTSSASGNIGIVPDFDGSYNIRIE